MSSTSRGMAVPNMNDVDVEVEIVDVIKPRHLRSPVIVIISSDSEDEILAQNPPSPDLVNAASGANRWSTSSEDEMVGRRHYKGKGKGKGKRSKQKSSSLAARSRSIR